MSVPIEDYALIADWLLSEEYDTQRRRLVGDSPQAAFSHAH